MSVQEVAKSLHVSAREVVRLADSGILPAKMVGDEWQFRSGEILNWIAKNLHALPERRRKDRDPAVSSDLLIAPSLLEAGVAIDLPAKTKSSLLRELAGLAAEVDHCIDPTALTEALVEREESSSTALQDGVAVPHPVRTIYSEGPALAAARTSSPIPFGQRDGGLSDLFFLVCCPEPKAHLLYLGRLCRLLIEKPLQEELRRVETAEAFVAAIVKAEADLCNSPG
ncbi:MAG: PTS sugar transporter subunit IIA [Planctomycetes bacterium]|nr:PTS sugar transporter subunit IIA [Planctomycetota bacterium]